ncbi:MAG TPA: cytochrome c, partial [Puia sp.]|nr:cytochrome c [Puia sp.]
MAQAQDGKALFQSNCASCHNPFKVITGPALKGVSERVPDKNLLHAWVHNSSKVLASGNPYFNNLFNEYNKTAMTVFGNSLSDADIDAIVKYVETVQPPTASVETGSPGAKTEENDNTLLYGILTLILAIIMFVLLQVNSSLKKLSDEAEGIPAHEPVPFYRNKVYIALAILVLFIVGGFYLTEGAIGL